MSNLIHMRFISVISLTIGFMGYGVIVSFWWYAADGDIAHNFLDGWHVRFELEAAIEGVAHWVGSMHAPYPFIDIHALILPCMRAGRKVGNDIDWARAVS